MTPNYCPDEELNPRIAQLRARGLSPKQISRVLGVSPALVAGIVRQLAADGGPSGPGPAPDLAGCWINPGWSSGIEVGGHPEWPRSDVQDSGTEGLVSILIARDAAHTKVSVCGYLVDVHCLGVKDALGPRTMSRPGLAGFRGQYFGGYSGAPVPAPLALAQQIVFGGIDYARGLGFEPPPDFARARGHLGTWDGHCDIRFGRDGKPLYVAGPYDDVPKIMRILGSRLGPDDWHYITPVAV